MTDASVTIAKEWARRHDSGEPGMTLEEWYAAMPEEITARQLFDLTPSDCEQAVQNALFRKRVDAEVQRRWLSETSAYGLFDETALLGVEDIEEDPDAEYFVSGFVERETLSMLVADSYVGKSYLALDWGLCVAAGIPWHGHQVTQGKVLYLMMEGAKTTKKRIQAWRRHNDIESAQLGDFKVSNKVLNSMDENSIEKLAAYVHESGTDLVIFDTLSRSIGGANENAQEDMGRFISAISRVREANPAASVLVLHHTKKDQPTTARGSTVLFAAMDTVWCLTRDDEITPYRDLENQKMKSGTIHPKHTMKFKECAGSAVLVKADKLDDDKTLLALAELEGEESPVRRVTLSARLVELGVYGTKNSADARITKLARAGKLIEFAAEGQTRNSLVKLPEF